MRFLLLSRHQPPPQRVRHISLPSPLSSVLPWALVPQHNASPTVPDRCPITGGRGLLLPLFRLLLLLLGLCFTVWLASGTGFTARMGAPAGGEMWPGIGGSFLPARGSGAEWATTTSCYAPCEQRGVPRTEWKGSEGYLLRSLGVQRPRLRGQHGSARVTAVWCRILPRCAFENVRAVLCQSDQAVLLLAAFYVF